MKILDGKLVSDKIKHKLTKEVNQLDSKPGLAVIQVGNEAASEIYVNNKQKAATEIGLEFRHLHFGNISEEDLILEIIKLNNDDAIDGIIVQLPLPRYMNEELVLNSIDAGKDVDGLTDINLGKLFSNKDCYIPCTPLGITELLNEYKIDVAGKNVVIVGRSRLVGKPMAMLLLNMDATVTICHSKTIDLAEFTSHADILIVAVGKRGLIGPKMVKNDVIIIDVGINRIDNKLYGDVLFDDVIDKVKYITPVPGGVGPMTVVSLLKNTIESYKKRH